MKTTKLPPFAKYSFLNTLLDKGLHKVEKAKVEELDALKVTSDKNDYVIFILEEENQDRITELATKFTNEYDENTYHIVINPTSNFTTANVEVLPYSENGETYEKSSLLRHIRDSLISSFSISQRSVYYFVSVRIYSTISEMAEEIELRPAQVKFFLESLISYGFIHELEVVGESNPNKNIVYTTSKKKCYSHKLEQLDFIGNPVVDVIASGTDKVAGYSEEAINSVKEVYDKLMKNQTLKEKRNMVCEAILKHLKFDISDYKHLFTEEYFKIYEKEEPKEVKPKKEPKAKKETKTEKETKSKSVEPKVEPKEVEQLTLKDIKEEKPKVTTKAKGTKPVKQVKEVKPVEVPKEVKEVKPVKEPKEVKQAETKKELKAEEKPVEPIKKQELTANELALLYKEINKSLEKEPCESVKLAKKLGKPHIEVLKCLMKGMKQGFYERTSTEKTIKGEKLNVFFYNLVSQS